MMKKPVLLTCFHVCFQRNEVATIACTMFRSSNSENGLGYAVRAEQSAILAFTSENGR
jgi:hypothetical protein